MEVIATRLKGRAGFRISLAKWPPFFDTIAGYLSIAGLEQFFSFLVCSGTVSIKVICVLNSKGNPETSRIPDTGITAPEKPAAPYFRLARRDYYFAGRPVRSETA